jgi:hypothetical protein
MSNKFNPSVLSFNVYETKKGELAIRLMSPPSREGGYPFSHCGYLTGPDGDFFFGSHPILGPKWEAAKVQLARAKAGVVEPEHIQAQPAPVQVAPAPEVKRKRKTRIAAESVQVAPVAPVAPAPVAPQIDLNTLAAQVQALTQAMGILLAPRK